MVAKVFLLLFLSLVIDFILKKELKILKEWLKNHFIFSLLNYFLYISFGIYLIASIFFFIFKAYRLENPEHSRYFYLMITLWMTFYFPKITYIIIYFFRLLTRFLIRLIFRISRTKLTSDYLKHLVFVKGGLGISFFMFVYILSGIFYFKNNIRITTQPIYFPQLPEAFDGFKIVQISDIHLGSYNRPYFYSKVIKKINSLNPDIIVFTGDMINFSPAEARPWIDLFKSLHAHEGKFSILGNHDFGDYIENWDRQTRLKWVDSLVQYETEMGFRVLRNEHSILKKNNDSIFLIGIDNWSPSHYMKYGNLSKAMEKIPENAFKILLSHDPSHWEYLQKNKAIIQDLTLSGHTHAAQTGFRFWKFYWSPVKWKYKYWGGLYSQDNGQYLYVNSGLGCIGFLGRLGIRPEITCIVLRKDFGNLLFH